MAPTSSDSSRRTIGTRKKKKAASKANTNAFALLSMGCLNAPTDTGRNNINTWIQSSAGAISPQVPFFDNNTRVEWDEPLEDDVDVRIVEEVRLGYRQQQPPLQERNRQENRVVATSGLEIIRPPAPGSLDLRRINTQLASKWAAASLRGKLLIEQVGNLQQNPQPAPATYPAHFRPPTIASSVSTPPQQAFGAIFANDHRNVPQPYYTTPIDASTENELQNERSTFLDSPYPNSLGTPSFDDVYSPLGSNRIEKGLRSIIEANKEIERFLAQGNWRGGRQQVAAHQGVGEENRNPGFGGSVNMIPINGGGYPHMQDGSEREAPKTQGTPYIQNAPARETSRAPASQYKSPYTKDTMSPYTKNSTNPYTNSLAVRGPQIAGVNSYTQNMPTREPPRKEGEFSRVHTALLLDASRAGRVMPEERTPKNLSSVPTNPSLLRNSSTSKSASPFAVVIHSPGPSKTPSNTKYHNSSTYPHPEPDSTDEAPAKSRIGDHRTSSFRVEINSSPMPSSTFLSGKKRGRPFANREAAAKAAEKAARQQLSENGENTGKKRGRPLATAEAAEKAAKKMKATEDDSDEPKKRARPFATAKKIEAPDPCFPVFYCEWKGCPAELHNLETLRKHLHILHGKRDKVTGMIPCMFRKCAGSHTEKTEKKATREGTEADSDIAKVESGHELSYPVVFKKRSDWHAHLEETHLIPIAWHLGDGPKFTEYSGPPGEYDIRKSEPWLFDANGNQVTPSVRSQKLEAGRASFNNGRRYKQQLLRELAQAKREGLLTTGNKVMKPSNSKKKGTRLAVVLNSRKISAEDYKKVDVDDYEDELALDNSLSYEDVFDEEDEE